MLVLVVAIIALQGPGGNSVQAGSRVPGGSVAPSGAGGTAPSGAGGTGHRSHHTSGSSSPAANSSARASSGNANSTAPASAREPLVVLNNTTVTGLAKQASRTFRRGGWTVTAANNYQNDILSTCAYYDPSVAGARAAALALQRQFPAVKRVEPQFAELAAWHSPIVVILTPDWTSS